MRVGNAAHFDFIVSPLAHPRNVRQPKDVRVSEEPWTRSDLFLEPKIWTTAIVGSMSPWIAPDAASPALREMSRAAFLQELAWASHLAVYAALLPPPSCLGCSQYAGILQQRISAGLTSTIWIKVPLVYRIETAQGTEYRDGWHAWNELHSACEYSKDMGIALEFTELAHVTDQELTRWIAEPVKVVLLSSDVFMANKAGYPVLSRRHKQLLLQLFRHKVQVVVSVNPKVDSSPPDHYIEWVGRAFKAMPALSQAELFSEPYNDYLQQPLQPLKDNLESNTYATFEKDPVKYVNYEEAVLACLQDKMKETGRTSFVIMVVGAGRGPLVAGSRSAYRRAGLKDVEVWAVEKNPNAVVTLRCRKRDEKWDDVIVIAHDMRTWQAPKKADILVSELLGSFGDNELSPECLDGAQRFLADDGVSIPQFYYSTARPVSDFPLWHACRAFDDLEHLETPYVVQPHAAFYPTPETKRCFEFKHPNVGLKSNDRHVELEFEAEADALIHGFAGYFHCDLYKDITISIEPSTFSEGMFSWFPIFFPVRHPFLVRKGDSVKMQLWRYMQDFKVWYEYSLSTKDVKGPIHNVNGRSYNIGM